MGLDDILAEADGELVSGHEGNDEFVSDKRLDDTDSETLGTLFDRIGDVDDGGVGEYIIEEKVKDGDGEIKMLSVGDSENEILAEFEEASDDDSVNVEVGEEEGVRETEWDVDEEVDDDVVADSVVEGVTVGELEGNPDVDWVGMTDGVVVTDGDGICEPGGLAGNGL